MGLVHVPRDRLCLVQSPMPVTTSSDPDLRAVSGSPRFKQLNGEARQSRRCFPLSRFDVARHGGSWGIAREPPVLHQGGQVRLARTYTPATDSREVVSGVVGWSSTSRPRAVTGPGRGLGEAQLALCRQRRGAFLLPACGRLKADLSGRNA